VKRRQTLRWKPQNKKLLKSTQSLQRCEINLILYYHSFQDFRLHIYQCTKLWISMYTILCIKWYTSIYM
jgi:hypothetical protein